MYFFVCAIFTKDNDIIKDKDIRDGLEHMYKAYDQRCSSRSSSASASSLDFQTLQPMWDQKEDIMTIMNDLDHYIVDRVLFYPEEKKANLEVLGWRKVNASTFPILIVITKDLLMLPMSTVVVESACSESSWVVSKY